MKSLITERLILRAYNESGLPEYHKLFSDKQNMYYLDDITTDRRVENRNASPVSG